MLYRDLVQFEPIETVIQIREANKKDEARRLVQTYVISDRMAEQLTRLIIPQLQFSKPKDNKGLLVVGNYGTGKSHLMSVISAIAEHADLLRDLRVPDEGEVCKAADQIAGKFKVIRAEIGASTRPLRDIVLDELASGLAQFGIKFTFPPMSQISNNKDLIVGMMASFQEKFPDQGLLLVIDELLEYLRARKQMDIVLDLSFLREVGEACRLTRFRFMAGIQESLFDSPRFQFVADSIRRVKDRFEQVRIARQDVAYVVAERLLKKNDKQRAQIREHLEKFTPLYDTMAERLEEFVRLFPIHPAYLDMFEQVTVVEKREALKTISTIMAARLDQQVKDDEPGLISYDSYWQFITENPSLRSIPDIRQVMDKSRVLEERVQHSFTKPALKPMALRIIQALSVQRLATESIDAPIGATAQELRDGLCLYAPMPEMDAEFLRTTVESTLSAILATVSGQFISFNPENGQYYLDLKKDVDFDAQIATQAEGLNADQLNRYYFDALTRLLEASDSPYVTGYHIWEHEVEWRGHGITRPGYLFFGTPNQRSTAQPPRDFYLYFVQPHETPPFEDARLADELFYRLVKRDGKFESSLKSYGGAMEMVNISSGGTKDIYLKKSEEHLKKLTGWLREHLNQSYEVTYKGVTKSLLEWGKGQIGVRSNLSAREMVNAVAAMLLSTAFVEAFPDYPTFSLPLPITRATIASMASEAVGWLADFGPKTKAAEAVLDGLELREGERVIARDSRYGKYFLGLLQKKGEGQAVNRSEIMENAQGVERDARFKLEPEWVAVTLLALANQGELVIAVTGKKIDASNLDDAAKMKIGEFVEFRHIERPKGMPVNALKALFELLGLPAGLATSNNQQEVIEKLQGAVTKELGQVVNAQQALKSGFPCWEAVVMEGAAKTDAEARAENYRTFLESLQVFNTYGKLKNLKSTVDEINAYTSSRSGVAEMDDLGKIVSAIQPLTGYLSTALAVLPGDHDLVAKIRKAQDTQLARLRDPQQRKQSQMRAALVGELEALKREYIKTYLDLHKRARLTMSEDQKKKKVGSDPRFDRLKMLRQIDLMPTAQLREFQNAYGLLLMCPAIGESDLANTPICPTCQYRPLEEQQSISAQVQLTQLQGDLERLYTEWEKTLLQNLDDPSVRGNLSLLKPAQRKLIDRSLRDAQLPDPITQEFITAVNDALKGFVRVAVTPNQLVNALSEGGMPCTSKELRARFENFIADKVLGKDESKVRFVIESNEDKSA